MRTQKKLMIAFLIGLLLMGLGTGVAFAEFSSFEYGGQKNIQEDMVSETLTAKMPTDQKTLFVDKYHYSYNRFTIESDPTVANDEIAVDVVYNKNKFQPSIHVYDNPKILDDYEDWSNVSKDDSICRVEFDYIGGTSDVSDFIKVKDEALAALKERKLYDYNSASIDSITLRVSPENINRVVPIQ